MIRHLVAELFEKFDATSALQNLVVYINTVAEEYSLLFIRWKLMIFVIGMGFLVFVANYTRVTPTSHGDIYKQIFEFRGSSASR